MMKFKNSFSLLTVATTLLGTLLASCSKETATGMFADIDCTYYGTLEVNRDIRKDMQLASFFMEGNTTESAPYPMTEWTPEEKEKEVLMGEHLVVYMPKHVVLDRQKMVLSLPDQVVSSTPLLLDSKRAKVPYNDKVTVNMLTNTPGIGLKIDLTNSSSLDLSEINITSSSAYLQYSLLLKKPIEESSFKHTKAPFDLESLGHIEMLGYAFGIPENKPIDMVMTFKDQNGVEYVIADDFKDIYKKDDKVSNLYVATIDLTDDYLINMGAKKKVTAVEIDGKDLVFPSAGGKMTMDVKAVVRTKTYQYGKVIDSVDGAEVPWSFEVKGDQNIKVIREGNSLIFTGPINDTPNSRTIEVIVTAQEKGVSRTFTVRQKPHGFDITGEVQ